MWIGWIPFFPVLAFAVLLIWGNRLSKSWHGIVGVSGIALAALFAVGALFLPERFASTIFWTWIPFYVAQFEASAIQFGFHIDSLALLMVVVVTFVASWIAVFSIRFMEEYDNLARYFASMNLFVASMLILVLADNLLLLFLGWEGVGLCSYLLIGFWYHDDKNIQAANKAFITTRIGDVALLLGIFLIFTGLGTLNIQEILRTAPEIWDSSSTMPTLVGICILLGACGKSAQIPLHNWLADAMRGPTPVSALIHAATMVTAGVYLIARLGGLFLLSPTAQLMVLVVGAVTLLVAGLCALVQTDLKRVLAYSTVSQIGYMFLALGAGAYSAAMFHFLTHAFFKALLFLTAGVIGYAAHHKYDMSQLGGLKTQLPQTYRAFLIGAISLSALPLVTSGFYSKEFILSDVYFSVSGGWLAWASGALGAFLTGAYTFRALLLTFFGAPRTQVDKQPDRFMLVPLWVLSIFSLLLGFIQTPSVLLDIHWFESKLSDALLPTQLYDGTLALEWGLLLAASLLALAGMGLSIGLYRRSGKVELASGGVRVFLLNGFGFDALYRVTLIRPYQLLCRWMSYDRFLALGIQCARSVEWLSGLLARLQNGSLSYYAGVILLGLVTLMAYVVLR